MHHHREDSMKPLAPALPTTGLALALLLPSALPAQTADSPRILRGKATVLDAGTLSVAGRAVRLNWISPLAMHSPPGRYQPKDREAMARNHRIGTTTALDFRPATDALERRIGSATVTCAVDVQKRLDHLFRPRGVVFWSLLPRRFNKRSGPQRLAGAPRMGQSAPAWIGQALRAGRNRRQGRRGGSLAFEAKISLVLHQIPGLRQCPL